jgi:hypothetical protein
MAQGGTLAPITATTTTPGIMLIITAITITAITGTLRAHRAGIAA